MNKDFAWFLGTLLSDGSLTTPTYRKKGDESFIQYCIHIKDKEMLYKIKNIINTRANILEYPEYKSPQCKINVYDRKDIMKEYSDIKTVVPNSIKDYERHFIRGIVDGDGNLYYRANRNSFSFSVINEHKNIIEWISKTLSENLMIPYKEPRHIPHDHIYEYRVEGNIAKLIAWWLYHGDIEDCRLERKYDYYNKYVLNNLCLYGDEELLKAVNASYINDNHITTNVQSYKTLEWCHRLQGLLSFRTTPVFHNKGKTKYYQLYIIQ